MKQPNIFLLASDLGLFCDSYSPGDGLTRYRFFREPSGYFESNGIYTAYGRKEALIFLTGFERGKESK